MLCITRKLGEKLCIGDDIDIVVTKLEGGVVRLSVKAPQDVKILRGELRRVPDDIQVVQNEQPVASAG
jgi:carbon storage regulator